MSTLTRHWKRWSGWYVYLAAVFAWLTLLGVILTTEGWLK